MRSRRVTGLAGLAMTLGLLAGVTGAVPVTAQTGPGSNVQISVDLFDRCFEVEAPSESGIKLRVVHRRGATVLADLRVPNLDDTVVCTSSVRPDDTITITDRFSSAEPAFRRTITVPRLRLTMDAANDVVTGSIPSLGPNVRVLVDDRVAGLANGVLSIPIEDAPDFELQLVSTIDLSGGDSVTLLWQSLRGDEFQLARAAPSVVVRPGSASVTGTGNARSTVTTVLRRNGSVRGTFSRTLSGDVEGQIRFSGRFRQDGAARTVGVGDKVSHSGVGGGPMLTVRNLQLSVNPANGGSLTASCFPGAPFLVYLGDHRQSFGVAGGAGEVSILQLIPFSLQPLASGLVVTLGCENPAGGGEVATFQVP